MALLLYPSKKLTKPTKTLHKKEIFNLLVGVYNFFLIYSYKEIAGYGFCILFFDFYCYLGRYMFINVKNSDYFIHHTSPINFQNTSSNIVSFFRLTTRYEVSIS